MKTRAAATAVISYLAYNWWSFLPGCKAVAKPSNIVLLPLSFALSQHLQINCQLAEFLFIPPVPSTAFLGDNVHVPWHLPRWELSEGYCSWICVPWRMFHEEPRSRSLGSVPWRLQAVGVLVPMCHHPSGLNYLLHFFYSWNKRKPKREVFPRHHLCTCNFERKKIHQNVTMKRKYEENNGFN